MNDNEDRGGEVFGQAFQNSAHSIEPTGRRANDDDISSRHDRSRDYASSILFQGEYMQPLKLAEPASVVGVQHSSNRLLAALPSDEYQRILPDLIVRPLRVRQFVHKHGERLSEVLFTGRGICSITSTMEDGGVVEGATVGSEGFVGVGAALGDNFASGDAFVQVQGDPALALSVDAFQREMNRRGPFYDLMSRYAQAFMGL